MERKTDWHRAVPAADVEDEDVVGVRVGEQGEHEIAVYKVNGRFYATADRCTHQTAKLSDGLVIDDCIECPLHQGRFHIPTGKPGSGPVSVPLRTYPVRVEDGTVFVRIDGGVHE
jgi:nitrite reductase/ring-hydroxylating ferredoxin subunit